MPAALNVCHDTPLGDFAPTSDISAPLQWAIDHQHQGEGFRPYVPAGHYRYSRPLRIPPGEGGYLGGMGRAENNLAGARLQTYLEYTGPADQPSIVYQGDNWTIEHLGFIGRSNVAKRNKLPRKSVGVLATMQHDQGGATTALRVTNVGFWGWDTGVQNGEDWKTSNCDMHVFTDCVFGDCQVGFCNRTRMGMHMTFVRPRFLQCPVGLRVEAGGTFYIFDAGMGGSSPNIKFLQLEGDYIGEAAGGFYIDGFKIDGSLDGTTECQIVEMKSRASAPIQIEKLLISNTAFQENGGTIATLVGDVRLTIKDSQRPGKVVCQEVDRFGRSHRPWIRVENTQLAGGRLSVEGPHTLVMRDCYQWNLGRKGGGVWPKMLPDEQLVTEDE